MRARLCVRLRHDTTVCYNGLCVCVCVGGDCVIDNHINNVMSADKCSNNVNECRQVQQIDTVSLGVRSTQIKAECRRCNEPIAVESRPGAVARK
jgi:hypothetical protein